jgi:hypothetical protein
MFYVTPAYFQVPVRLSVQVLLLMLGLIAVYSIIHVVSRPIVAFGRCLGGVVALAPLVGMYFAGGPGSPILGHGEGRLAAVTFLGVTLVVAGARHSRLRSNGDPRFTLWEAHRTHVSHLLSAR